MWIFTADYVPHTWLTCGRISYQNRCLWMMYRYQIWQDYPKFWAITSGPPSAEQRPGGGANLLCRESRCYAPRCRRICRCIQTIIYDYADEKNVMVVARITPNNTRHSSWTLQWFWSKLSVIAPWEYFVKKKSTATHTTPSPERSWCSSSASRDHEVEVALKHDPSNVCRRLCYPVDYPRRFVPFKKRHTYLSRYCSALWSRNYCNVLKQIFGSVVCCRTTAQWRRSVVKYGGGQDLSGQAIKLFQAPRKISFTFHLWCVFHLMMCNLQSYPTTVLNERMWHFRGGVNILWPLLHFSGSSSDGVKTFFLGCRDIGQDRGIETRQDI